MNKLNDFIDTLFNDDKSKNTIRAYKVDIAQFLTYYKNKDLKSYTKQDIEQYKNYLLNVKHLSISSINRKLIAIHEFFEFCEIPVRINQVKIQMQNFLNNVLSPIEISQIINIAREKNDFRTVAAVSTLKYTGMRVSEILQIKIDNINQNTINIIGKGKKVRKVFIPNNLHIIWEKYLPYRIKKSDYLFTGIRGKIVSSTVYKSIRRYGDMAGIDQKKCHPHSLRHAFCLSLAKKKIRIEDISSIVGHQSLETTKLYLRKTQEELLDIVNDI